MVKIVVNDLKCKRLKVATRLASAKVDLHLRKLAVIAPSFHLNKISVHHRLQEGTCFCGIMFPSRYGERTTFFWGIAYEVVISATASLVNRPERRPLTFSVSTALFNGHA